MIVYSLSGSSKYARMQDITVSMLINFSCMISFVANAGFTHTYPIAYVITGDYCYKIYGQYSNLNHAKQKQ